MTKAKSITLAVLSAFALTTQLAAGPYATRVTRMTATGGIHGNFDVDPVNVSGVMPDQFWGWTYNPVTNLGVPTMIQFPVSWTWDKTNKIILDGVSSFEQDAIDLALAEAQSYTDDEIANISLTPGPEGPEGPQGEKGDKGDQGNEGPQGIQGAKGDKGDTGDQGPQGDAGEKGDKGDDGDVGPKGDTGDTGPKGDKGDQGIQGPKGDTGDQGPAGTNGTNGAKGDKGDQGNSGVISVSGGIINSGTSTSAVLSLQSRSFASPARTIQTVDAAANGWQIDASRDAFVSYSVTIATSLSLSGGSGGYVVLEINATNASSGWTEVARVTNSQSGSGLVIGLAISQSVGGPLSTEVPAGYYVRVRSVNSSGTPTFTLHSTREIKLP